jgi:superfamily II DNA/RNA helicase
MTDPTKILVKSEMLTLEGIAQYHVALDSDGDKFDTLKDLYASLSVSQCIIYCNSIKRVDDLYDAMIGDDFAVSRLHGSMEKDDRSEKPMKILRVESREFLFLPMSLLVVLTFSK